MPQGEKGRGEGVKTGKTYSMGASEVRKKTYNTGHKGDENRKNIHVAAYEARRAVERG